jgi:hypothetical protein
VWRKNKNYSILILGVAGGAVLNEVHRKNKKFALKHLMLENNAYPLCRFGI